MVAVTFTDAAAGELKLRLRTAIERERQNPARPAVERERLQAALPQLEAAAIGTIHAFCSDLLRERPVEARVDPQFQVAPEDVARRLFNRVFDRWFEVAARRSRALACGASSGSRCVPAGPRTTVPRAALRQAAWDAGAVARLPRALAT